MTEVKKDEIDAVSFYKQVGNINDFFDYKQFSSPTGHFPDHMF